MIVEPESTEGEGVLHFNTMTEAVLCAEYVAENFTAIMAALEGHARYMDQVALTAAAAAPELKVEATGEATQARAVAGRLRALVESRTA